METFIAAFVFIISVAAIFSTMLSMRRPVVNNDQELRAALYLRTTLEEFRMRVDSNHANSDFILNGDLSPGSHNMDGVGPGGIYNIDYNISIEPASGAYKMDASIDWPDM